jgi:hypothetical protein
MAGSRPERRQKIHGISEMCPLAYHDCDSINLDLIELEFTWERRWFYVFLRDTSGFHIMEIQNRPTRGLQFGESVETCHIELGTNSTALLMDRVENEGYLR